MNGLSKKIAKIRLKGAPDWFLVVPPPKYVRKPPSVSTRMLVEDAEGTRFAKAALVKDAIKILRNKLPMGVSEYMPIYIKFVKAINKKHYSVYACYTDNVIYPLCYVQDIEALGELYKIEEKETA